MYNTVKLQTYQMKTQPLVCVCQPADLGWKNEAQTHLLSETHHVAGLL